MHSPHRLDRPIQSLRICCLLTGISKTVSEADSRCRTLNPVLGPSHHGSSSEPACQHDLASLGSAPIFGLFTSSPTARVTGLPSVGNARDGTRCGLVLASYHQPRRKPRKAGGFLGTPPPGDDVSVPVKRHNSCQSSTLAEWNCCVGVISLQLERGVGAKGEAQQLGASGTYG